MLNKVQIIGRLGRDPELRYTQAGVACCSLNVATDESYIGKDGQKVDRAEWHKITAFNKQGENCNTYLAKGSLVYVEGSLHTRKWQDQQGNDRYSTEIHAQKVQFLDRKSDNQGQQQQPSQRQPQSGGNDLDPAFPSEASGMDEVPF